MKSRDKYQSHRPQLQLNLNISGPNLLLERLIQHQATFQPLNSTALFCSTHTRTPQQYFITLLNQLQLLIDYRIWFFLSQHTLFHLLARKHWPEGTGSLVLDGGTEVPFLVALSLITFSGQYPGPGNQKGLCASVRVRARRENTEDILYSQQAAPNTTCFSTGRKVKSSPALGKPL